MVDILTQKFNYASIVLYRNYSRLDEKQHSSTSFNNSIDELDCDDEKPLSFLGGTVFMNPPVGRVVTLPAKFSKRDTMFFYDNSEVQERIQLNYAYVGKNHLTTFDTTKDRHIKNYYNNPFCEIRVKTIERSIRRHGDKITLKVYSHTKFRRFNSKYFKKTTSVLSATFNTKTGNFTTLRMELSPKVKSKRFRTNNFFELEGVLKNGGVLDFRSYVEKESKVYNNYKQIFNNEDFFSAVNIEFNFNQRKLDTNKFVELMTNRFVETKKIKVSNDFSFWIKNLYPTEKYLKKNERKLIASILDMFHIKSKITIKLMHDNSQFDIFAVSTLCYLFGDNFSKYIGSIHPDHFKNSKIDLSDNMLGTKNNFIQQSKNHDLTVTNIEKENIVKVINDVKISMSTSKSTFIEKRFISELVDHLNMIKKLRVYSSDLCMRARTYDEFNAEHMELSKMISFIKKGWVIEYYFNDKMVNDVEKPIKLNINLEDGEFGEITFYPYILKREEEYDEEGRFMHHCVASYSDKDKSIIISLRTENKEDRVTCEFDCQTGTLIQARHFCNKLPPADMELAIEELKNKTKYYSRMGMLHSKEKRKVPVKINGIEVTPEKLIIKPEDQFDRLFEPLVHF